MTRSNTESHWDEFCDWLEDQGIGNPSVGEIEPEIWRQWWDCWETALDAREASDTT